jgi:hypothetical protein
MDTNRIGVPQGTVFSGVWVERVLSPRGVGVRYAKNA